MTKNIENIIGIISLVLFGIFFVVLAWFNEGAMGGADNYSHFKIAKYAFRYPENFLDNWGKPVYTLLNAPFAQLGFFGMKLFNVLAGVLAAFFSWKISKHFEYRSHWLTPLLVCCIPVYFIMIPTAMTEILFSLFLVLAVILFLKERFLIGTILISFLPLIRTEGVFILFCFMLELVHQRKYRIIPLLLTGFVFYGIAGFFYFNDFFWIITMNPYRGAKDIYGSGELFHFIINYEEITGKPAALFLLSGIISLIISLLIKNRNKTNNAPVSEFLLVLSPILIFLIVHSYLWWRGAGGSLGLTRVMASVMPLCAILSVRGINFLITPFSNTKWIYYSSLILIISFLIRAPFQQYELPLKYSAAEELIRESSVWLKEHNYQDQKIYYYDPLYFYFLEMDPYDPKRCSQTLPDTDHPEANVKDGDLVLWDAHFGPNEGRTPLKNILYNEGYRVIKIFKPKESFTVLGNNKYEIYIFERVSGTRENINEMFFGNYTFESDSRMPPHHREKNFHNYGEYSMKLDSGQAFSPVIVINYSELQKPEVLSIQGEIYVHPLYDPAIDPSSLIFSFEQDNKALHYFGYNLREMKIIPGTWNRILIHQDIPPGLPPGSYLKCYFWYLGKKVIYIDNFTVKVISIR